MRWEGYDWHMPVNSYEWLFALLNKPLHSMPTHAGEGSVGKAPLLPSRGGELRTSAPVGPQFYSINCPGALVKASQPASHWHVISYQQTRQHLSLLEGGSQASSTPLPPQNRHSTKIT